VSLVDPPRQVVIREHVRLIRRRDDPGRSTRTEFGRRIVVAVDEHSDANVVVALFQRRDDQDFLRKRDAKK